MNPSRSTPDFNNELTWLHAHLVDNILPHWMACATTPEGLFLPQRDRSWQHCGEPVGTVVSQARLLYNFACGYRTTGNDEYREAVAAGSRFLLEAFADSANGGWHWMIDRAGTPLDSSKSCYGHAFAIFGLAHAFAVTREPSLQKAIAETWNVLDSRFRDAQGGLAAEMSADLATAAEGRSQNPLMHLFEALLAASSVGEMPEMLAPAKDLGGFVTGRLLDKAGRLPEVFDTNWHPLPEDTGGRLDIGHAFEWAFLLSEAAEIGLEESYRTTAFRMLEYGLEIGYDHENGGIFSPSSPQGVLTERTKGWWEQCEAVRALLRHAYAHNRPELLPLAEQTLGYIRRALVDDQDGGWFSSPSPKPGSRDEHKGSIWKVDYHVVGMCMEAVGILGASKV